MEGNGTVPALFPTPEGMLAARQGPLAVYRIIELDHAGVQAGKRHDDLERGAGRIYTLDRAVVHRVAGVVHELHPVFRRDPPGKYVRVVRGVACECEDLPVFRVHRHDGPCMVAETFLGRFLSIEVDGEVDVRAGSRLLDAEVLDFPARGIHLDHAPARDPAQQLVVNLFQPALARQDTEVRLFLLALGNGYLADITELVRGKSRIGI